MSEKAKGTVEEKKTESAKKPAAKQSKSPEEKQSKPKAAEKRVHIVKTGDTLRSISKQYYGSVKKMDAIRNANDLATDFLRVGRELILP